MGHTQSDSATVGWVRENDTEPMLYMTVPQARAIGIALVEAARKLEAGEEASCVVCGCTEDFACEGGCAWVPNGVGVDICSACVDNLIQVQLDRSGGGKPPICSKCGKEEAVHYGFTRCITCGWFRP